MTRTSFAFLVLGFSIVAAVVTSSIVSSITAENATKDLVAASRSFENAADELDSIRIVTENFLKSLALVDDRITRTHQRGIWIENVLRAAYPRISGMEENKELYIRSYKLLDEFYSKVNSMVDRLDSMQTGLAELMINDDGKVR